MIGFGGEKRPVGDRGVSLGAGASSSRRQVPDIAAPGDIRGASLISILEHVLGRILTEHIYKIFRVDYTLHLL